MKRHKRKILLVDDEPYIIQYLKEALKKRNYNVKLTTSGKDALTILETESFDLVITDLRMPQVSGMDILKAAKAVDSDMGVIVMTAYGTIKNAVEAMKIGAFDYITKPFSIEEIEKTINKYFSYKKIVADNSFEHFDGSIFENVIGKSEKMQHVFQTVETVARSKATVLIQGESGTGKELIARAIHYESPRRNKPFIKTNCAALPETLAESELYGHEKGAFTGAIRDTKGRFEAADGGTLLLDEISEMSLALQAKLLRVIQEKEFEKVGSPESVQVDVRIIATTNKDLKAEIKKGRFREDLYYRLNVVPIYLPPLRERKDDIPLLADYFLKTYARENNKRITGFSDEVLDIFLDYDWPGNVRELEHAIERAVVTSKEPVLRPVHFMFLVKEIERTQSEIKVIDISQKKLKDIEKQQILKILEQCNGNKTHAAQKLGISVRTLRNKLKRYQQEDND